MKRLLLTSLATILLLSAFTTNKKVKVKLPEEFTYIPAGTFVDFEPGEQYDDKKSVSLHSFYMSKYEVTNLQYRNFFNEAVPGLAAEEIKKIICDSSGWNNRPLSYGEPMVTYYYSHPAYNNYPVVNISYNGATKYCEWLQQKIQKDNPEFTIEVKIPSRQQWIWAAMGGRSQAMFPWGNYYLRNKKGEPMCNFRRVDDGAIYRNRLTGKPEVAEQTGPSGKAAYYTAAVKSFYPNDFGLYNMCGNAAEMVAEKDICVGGSWNDYGGDVHIRSYMTFEISAPTVGFRPIVIAKEKDQNK